MDFCKTYEGMLKLFGKPRLLKVRKEAILRKGGCCQKCPKKESFSILPPKRLAMAGLTPDTVRVNVTCKANSAVEKPQRNPNVKSYTECPQYQRAQN